MKRPPQIQFRLNREARRALEQIREALAHELGEALTLNKAARLLYGLGFQVVQDALAAGRAITEALEIPSRFWPPKPADGQRILLQGASTGADKQRFLIAPPNLLVGWETASGSRDSVTRCCCVCGTEASGFSVDTGGNAYCGECAWDVLGCTKEV